MVTQAPPDGNTTLATKLITASSILLVIALILYSLRMYTHIRPVLKLAGEDYIISLAVAIEIAVFSLLVAACSSGFGRHSYYVTAEESERALHYFFGVMFLGVWGTTLTRVSVAYLLLRLKSSFAWRVTLWTAITIQIVVVVGANICQFIQCTPLRTNWAKVDDSRCWTPLQTRLAGYTFVGLSVICDLFFALIPISFLWNLTRPLLERVLLAILMALGLCATAVAVLKIREMSNFNLASDFLRTGVQMALLSRVEEFVLIIAACAPFLKSPTENFLRHFKVLGFGSKVRSLKSFTVTDFTLTKATSTESGSEDPEAGNDIALHPQGNSGLCDCEELGFGASCDCLRREMGRAEHRQSVAG